MKTFDPFEEAIRSGLHEEEVEKEPTNFIHPKSVFAETPPKESLWKKLDGNKSSLSLLFMALLFMALVVFLAFKENPKAYVENIIDQVTITDEPDYVAQQQEALAKIEAWERVVNKVIEEHFKAIDRGHKRKLCITTGNATNCHKAFKEVQTRLH